MPIIAFHCTIGALTHEQLIHLLVWVFEIPPSKINISNNCKVEVPATITTLRTYMNCVKNGSYRVSAPKIISTPFGIVLRNFNSFPKTFTVDSTGYNMLCAMSGGHSILREWDASTQTWEITTGLGYRNTGMRYPITDTGAFKTPSDKTGIGFTGHSSRKNWQPILFVPATH